MVPVDMKPLRALLPGDLFYPFQIIVEVMVGKILAGAVLVHGVILPAQLPPDAGGMGLLHDPCPDVLFFRVADLCPALMVRDAGGVIGIDHGDDAVKGLDLGDSAH